jgi:hypothetical protein
MKKFYFFLAFCCLLVLQLTSYSQKKDPLVVRKKDSVLYISEDSAFAKKRPVKKQFDPRRATLYSTFLPGLGQIYNHNYWKLPLVYAGIGISAYKYFDNKSWYKKTQYALKVLLSGTLDSTAASWRDSLRKVDKQLRNFVIDGDDNDLRNMRSQARRYEDYSALFFLLFWGLNVVDATVDAHLKGFDVGTKLTIHIAPSAPGAPNGMGLVFDLHKPKFPAISLL